MVVRWFKKHSTIHKVLLYAIFSLLIVSIMAAVMMAVILWVFAYQLPKPDQLSQRQVAQSTKIFDRHGELLYEVYASQNRTLVELDDLPDHVIKATLAAEDADFYRHSGIDPTSLIYAAWQTYVEGNTVGGSTITQQLVKNTLLSNRRTLDRKVREAILSVQIEQTYSKDEILQMYLNEIPYGGQVYGIQAASQSFFGKDVDELTLAQAALIAGLPQSPTNYSPFFHPEVAINRQHYVLFLMRKAGYITEEEEQAAKAETIAFATPQTVLQAPWFTLWVKEQVEAEYGAHMVEEGGLRIYTTLDMSKQRIAEEEIVAQMERLAKSNARASQAALVSIDPKTGQVLAMVGSKDYFAEDGQFNAALGLRQPGSAIKPFVYLAALSQRSITPATMLNDVPTVINIPGQPPYVPQESDGKFWGPMLVRDALANSRNIPTLQVMQKVGVSNLLTTARKAGITTYGPSENYGISLSLGAGEVKPLELASAYSTLATGGVYREPVSILRIEDADGSVIREEETNEGEQVFSAQAVFQVVSMLSDNLARQRLFGARNLLELPGRVAAVKTGTTNDNRDAWTAGFTPSLVTAVWVGNFDNSPMNGIQGSTGATPIWHNFMQRVLANTAAEGFTSPATGLISKPITSTGQFSCGGQPLRMEWFQLGTEPKESCSPTPNPTPSVLPNLPGATPMPLPTVTSPSWPFSLDDFR